MGAVSAVKSRKSSNIVPILKKMMEAQKHRGNENFGIATNHGCFFINNLEELDQIQSTNVAIAHNMSKIDPSDSPQPIIFQNRSLIIESDYLEFQQSFDRLIETLSEDTPERSLTKFVSKIDGQYEIAVLYEGNIVVARDPVGLKPLHYSIDTDFIAL